MAETQIPLHQLSPRQAFILSAGNIKQHRALVENPFFIHVMDVALSEMTRAIVQLNGEHNLNSQGLEQAHAASFQLIAGAQNFREVILRLSDPPKQPQAKQPNPDVLDQTN